MAAVASLNAAAEDSPRSTIVVGTVAGEDMTTTGIAVGGMNQSNMASDSVDIPSKVPTPSKAHEDAGANLKGDPASQGKEKDGSGSDPVKKAEESPPTPSPQEYPSYLQAAVYPNLTPQQGSGYYHGYAQTPEPASPSTQPAVYDVNSFFQHPTQAGAFHPASATAGSTFLGVSAAGGGSVTLSPARGPMPTVGIATSMGSIPPSPLFPRVSSGAGLDAQRAPNLPYMSPQLSSYPSIGISSQSSDDGTGTWGGTGDRYVTDCVHLIFSSCFLMDFCLTISCCFFESVPSMFPVRALKPKQLSNASNWSDALRCADDS